MPTYPVKNYVDICWIPTNTTGQMWACLRAPAERPTCSLRSNATYVSPRPSTAILNHKDVQIHNSPIQWQTLKLIRISSSRGPHSHGIPRTRHEQHASNTLSHMQSKDARGKTGEPGAELRSPRGPREAAHPRPRWPLPETSLAVGARNQPTVSTVRIRRCLASRCSSSS